MADDCVPKVTPGENEAFLSLSLARGVIGSEGAPAWDFPPRSFSYVETSYSVQELARATGDLENVSSNARNALFFPPCGKNGRERKRKSATKLAEARGGEGRRSRLVRIGHR